MKKLFSFFTANKNRATFLAALWTLLILTACFLPGREVPDVHIPFMDKWVHFVLFGGFSFLWLCSRARATQRTGIVVFGASVLLGYMVELIQGSGLTTGRSYDVYDIYADAVGGLLGVLLFFFLRKRLNTPPE